MNAQSRESVHWDTSASGEPAHPSQAEFSSLREQLDECRGGRVRRISLQRRINDLKGMPGNRMATIVVAVILVLCAASLLHLHL